MIKISLINKKKVAHVDNDIIIKRRTQHRLEKNREVIEVLKC